MSTALVAGTMIGSGIFLLPASLAPFGSLSIGGWLFTTLGAVLLALTLGRLSRRIPQSGGPYVYTREAFGPLAGFLVGWGYWIAIVTGTAAVAVALVGYLGVFFPGLLSSPLISALAALAFIWLIIGINARGLQSLGRVQLWTTVLKILPILLVVLAGVMYFEVDYFQPPVGVEISTFSVITASATLTFWSFIGLESTTVSAESIANPKRNVPLSTTLGVLIVGFLYISGTVSVMGLLPNGELASSTAPFADAAHSAFGPWASKFVAVGAAISCLGALNGMIFVQGQIPFVFARDGLFPPSFSRLSAGGTPIQSFLLSGVLITLFLSFNYSDSLVDVFTFIILVSTLSVLLPFALSALAEIKFLLGERGSVPVGVWFRSLLIAGLALAYSLWAIVGSGSKAIIWGWLLLLVGALFYFWMKRKQ